MWQAVVHGRSLRFRLAGINNQNFLMADDATGSWWQQVSGEAIHGQMRGQTLEAQPWDELTFGEFVQEHPQGLVLLPDPEEQASDAYPDADWEERMQRAPVVTPVGEDDQLEPRERVIGLEIGGVARAYPRSGIARERVVLDVLGGVPVVLVAGEDRLSVRAFRRVTEGEELDFYLVPEEGPLRLVDAQTGSTWDFTGTAVDGPLAGRRLERVQALPDYWFDWSLYHPGSDVFATWASAPGAGG